MNLLEREGVMDAATHLLDQARAGRAGALFVLAEPGLGKTSVLDSASRLAKDDFSIGLAKGEAMETALPFGLLSQAFSALGGGDVLDGRRSPAPDMRAARFYAAWRWLESAAPKPALLALDDLHWADADSLALLSFLCRRVSALPVAVIATLRPWPEPARLVAEGLVQAGHAAVERLKPLSRDGAAALLADHAGRPLDDAAAERAAEICAGNPLLLEQVALAVALGEEIPRAGASDPLGVHNRLLLGRFAGLPAGGLRCAKAGAVFGIRFRPDLAVCLADLSQSEADGALDALDRSGLVGQARPGWVEFVHPLFWQALYDDLGGSLRARLHGRAFALLVERGLEDEAVDHAVKADLAGDATAVAVLHRVGTSARGNGATDSAISILESAVALAGDNASPELLCDLAELLAKGGRPADGKDVALRTLQLADLPAMIRVRTLEALARAHVFLGEFEAATRRGDECANLAEAVDPEYAVGLLFSYARAINFLAGQAAALPILDRARAVARACDAPYQLSAEVAWAYAALVTGDATGIDAAQGAARAVEAAAVTASGRDLLVGGGALSTYAVLARLTDRLAESELFLQARLRGAEQAGSPEEVGVALFGSANTLMRMLRLGEALAMAERCAALADLVPLLAPYAAADQANLLLLMGRLAESDDWASRADDLASAMGAWQPAMNLDYGRGWRCLAEGRLAEACARYEYLEATAARMGVREPCDVPWGRHAIAAYLGSGRRGDAERVLAWLEDCIATLPCRYPHIAISHGRALLAEDAGDDAAADGHFQQAMTIHGAVDLPLERLVTVLEYGRFLRRTGQLQRARPLLAEAAEVADAAGANWLAGQARQELRVAGGRRREKPDPGRLTPQEQRVAELAASGASNADIAGTLYVSVNTVETHLRHVYAKLGIRSRRQLSVGSRSRQGKP